MEMLGLKFAPISIPLERRLQTLAVFSSFIFAIFGGIISFVFCMYLFFYTNLKILVTVYFIWVVYDWKTKDKGGRIVEWVRDWNVWKYFCDYYPITLVKTAELPPEQNYILGAHPHGMLSSGVFGAFATNARGVREKFPGITPHVLTLESHFFAPIHRELPLSLGMCPVSRESIMYHLKEKSDKGTALVIIIGGAQEALFCKPGSYKLILKSRKGFVKIALETGTWLVPIISFGETDLYDQVKNPPGSFLWTIQNHIRKIVGYAPCLPIGRGIFQYNFGIVPQRSPVTVVVGKPIEVKQTDNPTDSDIQKLHDEYTKELVDLFETNKHKYVAKPDETHLEIV